MLEFSLSKTGKLAILSVALPTTILCLYILYRASFDDEEEDGEKTMKESTSRQTVIEMKIPHKAVGAVIGRHGQTIKEMQEQSGARMNFKDNPRTEDEDRTVVIRGTPEAAQSAECLIRKLLADMPVIIQDEIYTPGYALGRIIGKNGDTVRQMSRASNTKIYVDRTRSEYRDQPRLITISGTKDQIEIAKSMIQEKIDEEEQFRSKAAVMASNRETRPKVKDVHNPSVREIEATSNIPGEKWVYSNTVSDLAINDTQVSIATVAWPQKKDFVEVYVSAVANPGHFWVQLVSSGALQLDQDSEKMTRYYSSGPGKSLTAKDVKVGDYVAAPFEHDHAWYRAQVMGFEGSKADLLYVDYGDSGFVEKDLLKPLSKEFTALHIQAIECMLASVRPSGDAWTEEAVERFEELTHCSKWIVMIAKTESVNGTIPYLTLIDTNTDQDVNIGEVLVQEGHAVKS